MTPARAACRACATASTPSAASVHASSSLPGRSIRAHVLHCVASCPRPRACARHLHPERAPNPAPPERRLKCAPPAPPSQPEDGAGGAGRARRARGMRRRHRPPQAATPGLGSPGRVGSLLGYTAAFVGLPAPQTRRHHVARQARQAGWGWDRTRRCVLSTWSQTPQGTRTPSTMQPAHLMHHTDGPACLLRRLGADQHHLG
jgi:hypothetical protein